MTDDMVNALNDKNMLNERQIDAIERTNALSLFARFRR
jgi:hypothetical protein